MMRKKYQKKFSSFFGWFAGSMALFNKVLHTIIDIKFIKMVSAFSVPKAAREEKHSKNPGPGQYNPEHSPKHVKPTDPLYSFGKDVRKSQGNINPGPGAYEPKAHFVKDHKPMFSMMSRRSSVEQKLNVGPGQYTPQYSYGKDKSPAFSMRSKHDLNGERVPGPGQYEYKSHIAVKEKGHDFGKEARSKDGSNRVPGPGSYEYETAVFKYGSKMEPSYGFGSRLTINTDGRVPGPGTYEAKKDIYSHIGGIVGKDLRDSLVMNKTPGPGNYEHDINFKEKSPVWSLSKSSRDYSSGEKFNLGPGQYEHPVGYKKVIGTAPSYGFDGKSQKLKYDINEVPGPGAYERPLIKSRKSIKIAEKIKDLQGLKVPGPGSYEQFKYDNDSWAKGSGRYSIAKDSRLKESATFVPGPGAYENKSTVLKQPRGKVTFGRDDKLKYDLGRVPGPGHYDLKPTFADVPKYLLPGNS